MPSAACVAVAGKLGGGARADRGRTTDGARGASGRRIGIVNEDEIRFVVAGVACPPVRLRVVGRRFGISGAATPRNRIGSTAIGTANRDNVKDIEGRAGTGSGNGIGGVHQGHLKASARSPPIWHVGASCPNELRRPWSTTGIGGAPNPVKAVGIGIAGQTNALPSGRGVAPILQTQPADALIGRKFR